MRIQQNASVIAGRNECDDYQLIGKTDVGQLTIRLLDLNHERRIKIRQAEQMFGLFPP